ncbi:hypothetical protein DFQ05_1098 [Winogradskyella wandonensis]|uniref:Uncharacterized protein n=1 Tax=Winogradskyella wandonensis TaxID=1442586 RepID=A0A4R1KQL2_9FLAO|nr:hypothetical protein [Winogradskyella wandonensis]TCK67324.1 hypothetical protein DFQ05_1098 [Winogradskyella wandonensis]
MKKIGIYAILIGLALIILPYFGLTLRLFGMIDELGETPAWAIKIGLVVIGAVLFFVGSSKETEEIAKQNTESKA